MTAASLWPSRALVLAAAVLWSLSGVILKAPAFADLPADSRGPIVAGCRAGFAALVLLPALRPQRIRWRLGLVPMTLCFAAMSVLFISALMTTTAAATIFLQYTSVLWACLLGWAILGEHPGRPDAAGLLFVASGIGLILANEPGSPLGNALALASGVAYAGVVVSLRALRDEDPVWLSFLNQSVTALIILPVLLILPVSLSATQILLLAFLGAVQLALPYVLFSIAVRRVPAGEASLLLLVEPVLNPLWVLLAWGEQAAWTTWLGGGIILAGVAVRFAASGAARTAAGPPRSSHETEPTVVSASVPPARRTHP